MTINNVCHRILVTGTCGAGKTTFSKKLAGTLNVPLIHLDKEFWQPNWGQLGQEQWRVKVSDLVKGDNWVIEGNYSNSFDIRFPRATMILHLEVHRLVCLYRCIKRSLFSYGKVRDDMAPDCPERFDLNFYKYVWNFHKIQGPRVLKAAEELFDGEIILLKSKDDKEQFLKKMLNLCNI